MWTMWHLLVVREQPLMQSPRPISMSRPNREMEQWQGCESLHVLQKLFTLDCLQTPELAS
jgi:hypothetical protein